MRGLVLGLTLALLSVALAASHQASAQMQMQAAAPDKPVKKPSSKPPAKSAVKKKPPSPPSPIAKEMFGAAATPAPLAARSIGGYAKGCLAGGVALPINGPNWQVMRLSRNRNWGNPRLLDYLERLSSDARALDGWPGLLIGDMSQPRGGPMLTGHTSHQIGLDADIWLTPMPDRILTPEERENMIAQSMLKDPFSVDPQIFTEAQAKLIKRAASYPQVARIFVHPAIKKALCEMAPKLGKGAWLGKVRPWWNHHYHFHVRLSCPPGAEGCEDQKPVAGDDGCGQELKNWYDMLKKAALWAAEQQVRPESKPVSKKPPLRMADLPKECASVLTAGGFEPPKHDEDGSASALPPAALAAMAAKDAGPPIPLLTAAQVKALTESAKPGGDRGTGGDAVPLPDRNPSR